MKADAKDAKLTALQRRIDEKARGQATLQWVTFARAIVTWSRENTTNFPGLRLELEQGYPARFRSCYGGPDSKGQLLADALTEYGVEWRRVQAESLSEVSVRELLDKVAAILP